MVPEHLGRILGKHPKGVNVSLPGLLASVFSPRGSPFWVCPLGQEEQAAAPDTQWVPSLGGGIQPGRRLVEGVKPPHGPPLIYTYRGFILVRFY